MCTLIWTVRVLYVLIAYVFCRLLFPWKSGTEEGKELSVALSFLLLYAIGNVMELLCQTQEAAMLAMQIASIALLQAMGATALFVQRYIRVRIPKLILLAAVAVHLAVVSVLLTSSSHTWYAKKVWMVHGGTYAYVQILPNVFAYLHQALILVYALFIPAAVLYFFHAEKNRFAAHKVRSALMQMVLLLPIAAYSMDWWGGLKPYLLLPVGLLLAIETLFWLIRKNRNVEMLQHAKDCSLDTLEQAILLVDNRHHTLYSNAAAKKLMRAVDKPTGQLLLRHTESGELTIGERHYGRKITPIYDNGVRIGVSIWIHDTTETHQMMQRLIACRDEADQANQAKSEILADTSHEIKTPMNAIIGMSEIALRKNMSDDLRQNIQTIHHAGKMLLNMVNHLLDISKIETGNMVLQEKEYHLDSVLFDVSMLASADLYDRPIQYSMQVQKNVPNGLVGDSVRVKEILVNLLGNAAKYTEKGEVKLTVRYKNDPQGARIQFEVADTGIGILQEDLEQIFKPYRQVTPEQDIKSNGVGLGLSIVKQLVEMMQGSIQVESEYGKGSTFQVEILQKVFDMQPAELQEIPEEERILHDAQEHASMRHQPILFPEARILIVDDMEMNLQVAEGLLKPYQVRVYCAESGKKAIEMILENQYDLVLMDYKMLDMDGIEAVQTIRQTENVENQTLPIVALTANTTKIWKDFLIAKGFTDFLEKPIQVAELEQVLVKLLSKPTNESENWVLPESFVQLVQKGIDTVLGLKQCGGKWDNYQNILYTYLKETKRMLAELPQDLETDIDKFAMKVHGIKGASRIIGALQLGVAAEEIEQSAKQGNIEQAQTLFPAFAEQTQSILQTLEQALSAVSVHKEVPEKAEHAPPLDRAWWEQLLTAVQQYDLQTAQALLQEAAVRQCSDIETAYVHQLEELLDAVEYEAAQTIIEQQLHDTEDSSH